ncbi:MAG: hypothetical protein B6242_02210 [Anaerolineaceae bacterium 4572_78]|nr:MAG: hypothetical protein B6242_02210 [Anaerolineaceae bacterium 4572_78]
MTQLIVSIFIQWLVVPSIILGVFSFATTIIAKAPKGEINVSAHGGFWAGIVLFVMYVVSQIGQVSLPHISLVLPVLKVEPLGLGLVIGFALVGIVRYVIHTRFVGLLSLLLISMSATILFQYVFFADLRSIMLSSTLGFAFGALLHISIFPNSIRELWS